VKDAWISGANHFLPRESATERFGLLPQEQGAWVALCDRLLRQGQRFLNAQGSPPGKTEWLGIYACPADANPLWVAQGEMLPTARFTS
jgi:hypothetical protein